MRRHGWIFPWHTLITAKRPRNRLVCDPNHDQLLQNAHTVRDRQPWYICICMHSRDVCIHTHYYHTHTHTDTKTDYEKPAQKHSEEKIRVLLTNTTPNLGLLPCMHVRLRAHTHPSASFLDCRTPYHTSHRHSHKPTIIRQTPSCETTTVDSTASIRSRDTTLRLDVQRTHTCTPVYI